MACRNDGTTHSGDLSHSVIVLYIRRRAIVFTAGIWYDSREHTGQ